MIVTHCGSAIVGSNEAYARTKLRTLEHKYRVKVEIARDAMELVPR